MTVVDFVKSKFLAAKLLAYRKLYIPIASRRLQKKENIRVLFILINLGAWKTESLYREMLRNPRFTPILLLSKCSEEDDTANLLAYCRKKGYDYELNEPYSEDMWPKFRPDIIFYQKPYGGEFIHNLKSLFCFTCYGFRISEAKWGYDLGYLYNCWQIYHENEKMNRVAERIMGRGTNNGYHTGIPMMDELLAPKENSEDPWKQSSGKKRIIFAPHHSVSIGSLFKVSTFLQSGELMLEIAEKYSDRVQWAFKPHPLLRYKLEQIWGKEKTAQYYDRWATAEWSQYESGKYLGLFNHSDALIHDCASFTIEYLYTLKPVMYLTSTGRPNQEYNWMAKQAFELHTKGIIREEIESFIEDVLECKNRNVEEKKAFIQSELTPPFQQTAAKNIIDCILSREAAAKMK